MGFRGLVIIAALHLFSELSSADEYHYTNQILGDRNLALGGAAAAITADPTSLYYNPSGLAFSKGVNVSGSMTSYAIQRYEFEDLIATQDFEVKSDGIVANYIGFESKFEWLPDWKFAFGIFVPDSFRQSQSIAFESAPDLKISDGYWQRKQDAEESIYSFGAGRMLGADWGIGWSAGYYQYKADDMLHSEFNYEPTASAPTAYRRITANYKAKSDVLGVQYNLGLRYVKDRHVIGVRLQTATILSQTRRGQSRRSILYTDAEGEPLAVPLPGAGDVFQFDIFDIDDDRAFGEPPTLFRVGYSFSDSWGLVATDIEYAHSRYDRFLRTRVGYVLNYHLGTEINIGRSIRLRMGTFSNNDSRPKLTSKDRLLPSEEKFSIDFLGYTGGLAYYSLGSQYSIGAVYQKGIGKAALVSRGESSEDSSAAAIDRVTATNLQLALGLSSSL